MKYAFVYVCKATAVNLENTKWKFRAEDSTVENTLSLIYILPKMTFVILLLGSFHAKSARTSTYTLFRFC